MSELLAATETALAGEGAVSAAGLRDNLLVTKPSRQDAMAGISIDDDAGWFEFNDRRVDPFPRSRIASEAFGGRDAGGNQNAFLLIYDRIPEADVIEWLHEARDVYAAAMLGAGGCTSSVDPSGTESPAVTGESTSPKRTGADSLSQNEDVEDDDGDDNGEEDDDEDHVEGNAFPSSGAGADSHQAPRIRRTRSHVSNARESSGRVPLPRSIWEAAWSQNLEGQYIDVVTQPAYAAFASDVAGMHESTPTDICGNQFELALPHGVVTDFPQEDLAAAAALEAAKLNALKFGHATAAKAAPSIGSSMPKLESRGKQSTGASQVELASRYLFGTLSRLDAAGRAPMGQWRHVLCKQLLPRHADGAAWFIGFMAESVGSSTML